MQEALWATTAPAWTALSALQGLLPKSRAQESIFEGLLGTHAFLGLYSLPTLRCPSCAKTLVGSQVHGNGGDVKGPARPVLMNNTAGHQMDPKWHLSQPRLGLPTEEPGLGVIRLDISGSGLLSDAL